MIATIVISILIAAGAAALIAGLIRDKKSGKGCCGGCAGCSMAGSCHHGAADKK